MHGCKWETVTAAVQRFQAGGIGGLADAQHPGRPRVVSETARGALREALRAPPRAVGLSGWRWTAKRVQQSLRRWHCHKVSPTTAWREGRRCGRVRKRGKYDVQSPDPEYAQKKGHWTQPSRTPTAGKVRPAGLRTKARLSCYPYAGRVTGESGRP